MSIICKSNAFYSPFNLERALKDADNETITGDYGVATWAAVETITGMISKKRISQVDTLGKERTYTRDIFHTSKKDILKDSKIYKPGQKPFIVTEQTDQGVYLLS